jgi:glutamate:Na+ symporter, ESS family
MIDYKSMAVWAGILAFALLCLFLLIGNIVRRKLPFLRKYLLPTAVIGGLIALVVKEGIVALFVAEQDLDTFNNFLTMITYHAIALGFIAMGLKVNEKLKIKTNRAHSYFNGMLIVSTYLLQGLIGIVLTFVFAYTFFPAFQTSGGLASGLLFPLGFGQGPGTAAIWGQNYSNPDLYFENILVGARSYGLAISSMGFLWACIGGVIYLNIKYKKKRAIKDEEANLTSLQQIEAPDEIPVAESIDKLTIQVSLVLMVYFVTYGVMMGLTQLASLLGGFGNTIISLVWSFNFIIGMLLALLFKNIFVFLRKKNIMTRQYPNNFMLNRISGTVFDLMVIASITAIKFEDLSGKWIPFFVITTVIGLTTMFYMYKLTQRIYKQYPLEAFCGMYGMLTGTASTGIALLREVDPEFQTPAATDLVTGSATAILFGFPILLLAGFAPVSFLNVGITTGVIIVLFAIFFGILIWKHPKVKREAQTS